MDVSARSVWITPTAGVFASSAISPVVFAGPQQGGGEVLAPTTDATGTVCVVPGAVGATPGALVVYLTKPIAAARTRPLVVNAIGNMGLYETYDYEAAFKFETWDFIVARVLRLRRWMFRPGDPLGVVTAG